MADDFHVAKGVRSEWERLVFPKTPLDPEAKARRWRVLYDSCFFDGEWQVGIESAGLVTTLGMNLQELGAEFDVERCTIVAQLGTAYLAHPDSVDGGFCRDEVRRHLGMSRILSGRLSEGVALWDEVLDDGFFPRKTMRLTLQISLLQTLHGLGFSKPVAEEIKEFASRLHRDWPGEKWKARRALLLTTNEELHDLVIGNVHRSIEDLV